MTLQEIEKHLCFGGIQKRFKHFSSTLKCYMNFSVYLPPQYSTQSLSVLYWLSGLTCTDENFSTKSGAQYYASKLGIILIIPDTSPRGETITDDPEYDLGQGASFYINATQEKWYNHYQMFDYITEELPSIVNETFNINGKQSISGHSMGGHGALMIALRKSKQYCCASAFAPIVNPMNVPWGQKIFTHYLGNNPMLWQEYDSCYLLQHYQESPFPILIDQGNADPFLSEQLKPDHFHDIALQRQWPLTMRYHDGYDHSYYFINSFIKDHLEFHHQYLST